MLRNEELLAEREGLLLRMDELEEGREEEELERKELLLRDGEL